MYRQRPGSYGDGDAVGLWIATEEDQGIGAVGQVGNLERVVGKADAVGYGAVVLVFAYGDGVALGDDVHVDATDFESAVEQEVVMCDVEGAMAVAVADGVGAEVLVFLHQGRMVGVIDASVVADVLHGDT